MGLGVEWLGGLYFLAAAVPLLFLRIARRHADKPASTGFAIMVGASSLWAASVGLTVFVRSLELSVYLYKAVLLGAHLTSLGWLLMAVGFVDPERLTRRLLVALVTVVGTIQALLWTNPLHHAVWTAPKVVSRFLVVEYGPLFWLYLGNAWVMTLCGIVLLAGVAVRSAGIRRRQAGVLAFVSVPVVVLSAASIFNWPGGHPYNLTPFGFVVAQPVIAWVLYRHDFLDVVPVARNTVVEQMDDLVVTLDGDDRVVDFNRAAQRTFDVDADDVGRPVDAVLGTHLDGFEAYATDEAVETEVELTSDGTTRQFHLSITPLGEASATDGSVVVLREITTLKRRERQLRESEQQLDLLRQVLSRVLRHNLRNDLQVVRYCIEELPESDPDEQDELVERATTTIAEMIATSEKARRIERVLQRDDIVTTDASDVVERVVTEADEEFPDATVDFDGPETAPVRSHPHLVLAVEDLVENGIVHNPNPSPSVEVVVQERGEHVLVTVRDDGPGIPDAELDVLRSGRETDLEHGSGGGLWVVTLFVESSGGDLSFDTSRDGTTVTMHLQAADAGPATTGPSEQVDPSASGAAESEPESAGGSFVARRATVPDLDGDTD